MANIDCANCLHKNICFVGRWVIASREVLPDEEERNEPIVLDGEITIKKCEYFKAE